MECPVCYCTPDSHYTLTCGHKICTSCVKQWFITSLEPDCPMCRAPLNFRGMHRVREKWENEAFERRVQEHYGKALDSAIQDWIQDLPSMCVHAMRAVEHNLKEIYHIIHELPDDIIEAFLDSNKVVTFPVTKYMEWDDFTRRKDIPSKHQARWVGRKKSVRQTLW